MQDNRLLLDSPASLDNSLEALRLLGVQRLQLSVAWDALAPLPDSHRAPPGFSPTDPGAYPAASWLPYDRVVSEARRYGLSVTFELGAEAPLWAVKRAPTPRLAHVWYPNPTAFSAFVEAVGDRYGGAYIPPGATAPLPRVDDWSIWEEPNAGAGSLAPQAVKGVEVSPALYRGLANGAYRSLVRAGHRRDRILVGGMAASGRTHPGAGGPMNPLRFLRALFCVNSSYQELRGNAAAQRGCPTTAAASHRFRASNPALFRASGWAEHPYYGTTAPDRPSAPAHPDWVTFADLPTLEGVLDRLQSAYGSPRRFGIYVTAYGFNTNPPQKRDAVRLGVQASYLNEAEYLAWRDPRIQRMTQYPLADTGETGSPSDLAAGGLLFATGSPKPALDAYRLPLWIPQPTVPRGNPQEVWGCIRPSDLTIAVGTWQTAQIQFQPGSSGQFLWIGSVTVKSPMSCYFDVHMQFPESGTLRVAYAYPAGDSTVPAGSTVYSRNVRINLGS